MKKYAILLIFLLIAAAGGWLLLRTETKLPESVLSEQPANSFVEIPKENTKETVVIKPEQQRTGLPAYQGEPIAYLGADPAILSQLPPERVQQYQNSLKERAVALAKNAADYDSWIAVGIYKKFFNNYTGARDAWEYAKIVGASDPQAYLNLASLYAYYLRDVKEAEKNFLAAVNLDRLNYSNSFYQIAAFYRDFGQKELAIKFYRAILEFNPDDEAVKTELERLENP